MASCTICERDELNSADELERQVCDTCARVLGVATMPKPHRPPIPCQRCEHLSFVRAIPRELTVQSQQFKSGPNPAQHTPMFVTYEITTVQRLIREGKAVEPLDPYQGRGVLEMYICRHCGFVEWYCMQPAELPIGPQYMTQIVEYESQERPFR